MQQSIHLAMSTRTVQISSFVPLCKKCADFAYTSHKKTFKQTAFFTHFFVLELETHKNKQMAEIY